MFDLRPLRLALDVKAIMVSLKKAFTDLEEACEWDSVKALSKENRWRHSLNSSCFISIISIQVNSNSRMGKVVRLFFKKNEILRAE